jgi:hypothetical protein
MKLGLIVECAPSGLEAVVCPKILQLLAVETNTPIEYKIETMINKRLLILGATDTAGVLLRKGFDRVVVLWDENPGWTPEEPLTDRCWHIEREQLLTNLKNAKIDRKVGVVCIEREFEAWLLHDTQLLRDVISTPTHPAKVKRVPDPAQNDDPKATLEWLFSEHKARYTPELAAIKFARKLDSLDRLKDCDTFRYFVQKILGKMPTGWKPYQYQPKGP